MSTGTLLSVALGHNALGQRVRMDVTGGSLAANFPDKTLHYDEAGHVLAEVRAEIGDTHRIGHEFQGVCPLIQ